MKGNITKRGERSFRIKVELSRDPETGKRRYHLETLKGLPDEKIGDVRARAKARLVELLHDMQQGAYVQRSTATVEEYMRAWLDEPVGLNPKTIARYKQIAEHQIYPHLGNVELQKLSESMLQTWHGTLLARGGTTGKPLSPQTVKHAHRLLHTALARALLGKLVLRNVASAVNPPKVPRKEAASLTAEQIGELLDGIQDHRLYTPAVIALGTGLRRGELLALRWQDVDLEKGYLQVGRSLGEAEGELYFKEPKSDAGHRSLSLAPFVIDALRDHRKQQLELRLQLGVGKMPPGALLFSTIDGDPVRPDKLSRDWANLVRARKLPKISFQGLRHSNVSMLIDGGLDVYQVSRRIGHSNASLTLKTYTHLFRNKEDEAVEAIESAFTR